MRQRFETAHPQETLDDTFVRLNKGRYSSLPVVEDGRLVGLVTLDSLIQWIQIQEALREAGERQHHVPCTSTQSGPILIGRSENRERVRP